MTSKKATSKNAVATDNSYEFCAIPNEGKVNVANHSHEDVREHTYTVTVEDGCATDCTCPGHEHGVSSKHREAVEARQDVIDVADPSCCPNGHEFCVGPDGLFAPDDGGWRCASCFMEADV